VRKLSIRVSTASMYVSSQTALTEASGLCGLAGLRSEYEFP